MPLKYAMMSNMRYDESKCVIASENLSSLIAMLIICNICNDPCRLRKYNYIHQNVCSFV